jgi:hypothetical protein
VIVAGTVKSGTLKLCELLPCFMEEVNRIDKLNTLGSQRSLMVEHPKYIGVTVPYDCSNEWWDSEEAAQMFEDIVELINTVTPGGLYFGSHPDDGADWGYWEIDRG